MAAVELRLRRRIGGRLSITVHNEDGDVIGQTELTAPIVHQTDMFDIGWLPFDIELEAVDAP